MNTKADTIALNTAQEEAERDSFTYDRYVQMSRFLPADAVKVLDVGCATGRGGTALKDRKPALQIFGLDCLQHRLDRLPSVYSGKVCSFTTDIDAEDGSFDAVVAGEFIEHLTYEDGITTLKEFRRILRPGGRLLMTTPYPDYLKLVLTGRSTVGGAHLSAHYPKQLMVLMNETGFRDVKWKPSGKVTRYLGEAFPMWFYGSFLIWGDA